MKFGGRKSIACLAKAPALVGGHAKRHGGVLRAVVEIWAISYEWQDTLQTRGASQLYISLGDVTDGGIAVRAYHKPMVLLIWWGPVLMAFGGLLSLSDRRLRVGAPKPARAARQLQAAE